MTHERHSETGKKGEQERWTMKEKSIKFCDKTIFTYFCNGLCTDVKIHYYTQPIKNKQNEKS